jgi:hypothetical protein
VDEIENHMQINDLSVVVQEELISLRPQATRSRPKCGTGTSPSFAGQIAHFSACIAQGTAPEADGNERLADLRVLPATEQAARTSGLVTLPPRPFGRGGDGGDTPGVSADVEADAGQRPALDP